MADRKPSAEASRAAAVAVSLSLPRGYEASGGLPYGPCDLRVIASAFDAFAARAVAAEMARCVRAVREKCEPCGGTGHADGVHEYECEYCGRPISAICALPVEEEK